MPSKSFGFVAAGLEHDLRAQLLHERVEGKERAVRSGLTDNFDGVFATEMRLWHALEKQLIAPFEYYG